MRFLLVLVSIIFSFIFFLFYTASLWKNIFFQASDNFFFAKSFFWEMWITPMLFILITLGLFIYFKSKSITKKEKNTEGPVQEIKIINYIFYIFIFYITILIIFFILNISFNWIIFIFTWNIGLYFIWKYLFYHHKINKKTYISTNILSILSGYLVSIIGIIYIIYTQENIIFIIILNFIAFFHVYTHLKYENIISLLFWIITFIFALYRLITYIFPWII